MMQDNCRQYALCNYIRNILPDATLWLLTIPRCTNPSAMQPSPDPLSVLHHALIAEITYHPNHPIGISRLMLLVSPLIPKN